MLVLIDTNVIAKQRQKQTQNTVSSADNYPSLLYTTLHVFLKHAIPYL